MDPIKEDSTDTTQGEYTARDFLHNLSKSMSQDPESLYPEKADKIFKINDLVDLRLINKKTYIYINDKRYVQCFNLLLNPGGKVSTQQYPIKNMDEASQVFGGSYSQSFIKISPEETFMAHCSNIQAFFEHGLNTDLLHSNVAFPLLKKLVNIGYRPAVAAFKKEIIKRYNEGTWRSRTFLKSEGYLKYLDRSEKKLLKKDKKTIQFPGYKRHNIPETVPVLKRIEKINRILKGRITRLRVYEFIAQKNEFKEVRKKFPLNSLLNSDNILLFADPLRDKAWIWHGGKTTKKMKHISKKMASKIRDRYGTGYNITAVDEGLEPLELKNILITKVELDYERAERRQALLPSLPRYYHILIQKGIDKVHKIMKEESLDKLTIHRRYLPEFFNRELIEISDYDGYPILKKEVLAYFSVSGILSRIYGNVLEFLKIPSRI